MAHPQRLADFGASGKNSFPFRAFSPTALTRSANCSGLRIFILGMSGFYEVDLKDSIIGLVHFDDIARHGHYALRSERRQACAMQGSAEIILFKASRMSTMDTIDLQLPASRRKSTNWNQQPIYFKGFMGFTGSREVGFNLLVWDLPAPRVKRVELCRLTEETTVTLLLEDECSRAYLGQQACQIFKGLKRLRLATIRIYLGRKVVEEYCVEAKLAKY
ncbi:hypothetical protein AB7783_07020 [Tardiphaga sp. 172_B4_N1_3]|uniref:hypothetical protein n=1 Tax=Tardiphaga sp. 172_B4_N1_3 TaxID=3240787 RepID=UPI003F8CC522